MSVVQASLFTVVVAVAARKETVPIDRWSECDLKGKYHLSNCEKEMKKQFFQLLSIKQVSGAHPSLMGRELNSCQNQVDFFYHKSLKNIFIRHCPTSRSELET